MSICGLICGQQSNLNLQAPGTRSNQGLANAEKASIQQKLDKKKMRKGQIYVNLRAIEVQSLHNCSTIKIALSLRSQPTNLILKIIASHDSYGSLFIIVSQFA